MRTVLFVDDSSDLCQIMEIMCQSLAGVECICVPSMSAVLGRAAQVLRTELAILDVNLGPGEPSGVEICRWLKGQNYRGKIVFLSGHARTDPLVEEAVRISGVDFFQKPLEFDQIEALILGTRAA
jgi:FixJ family two-component response regulator